MLSETLMNELQRYTIGPRVKALRLRKKLGLVQLAAPHWSLLSHAIQDRTRPDVSHAPDSSPYRDGFRRWA